MPLIEDDHLPKISTLQMSIQEANLPLHIRIRNRRKRYLEENPSYFSPELESADPLLYDRLVRKHYTPADHEIERRQKGYAGSLESDLFRSEAKLEQAQSDNQAVYVRAENGEIVAQFDDEEELTREEAYDRWYEVMERRFLDGHDTDFDYEIVDSDERYDDRIVEERERQEEWFDEEEAEAGKNPEGETGVQDF